MYNIIYLLLYINYNYFIVDILFMLIWFCYIYYCLLLLL